MTVKIRIVTLAEGQVGYFQKDPADWEYTGPDPTNHISDYLDRMAHNGPHYAGLAEEDGLSQDELEMSPEEVVAEVYGHLRNVQPPLLCTYVD